MLRKYDLAVNFKERQPPYITEWVHEMMLGKGLQQIAKRGIELVREAREKHGPTVQVNLHLAWFGNELVCQRGVAPNPTWPFEMGDCKRHIRWLKKQCRDLEVATAGFTTAPWSADYGIHPIFDQFYESHERLFEELSEEFLMEGGYPNPRFAWLPAKGS